MAKKHKKPKRFRDTDYDEFLKTLREEEKQRKERALQKRGYKKDVGQTDATDKE